MAQIVTNRRKVTARLQSDGWISYGGKEHEIFKHPARPAGAIAVPRHRELSIGVARKIAKAAGWA